MRGKAFKMHKNHVVRGITPAYAGKSHKILCIINDNRDHPRLCGEKENDGESKIQDRGSPPPMRGKGSGFP